MEVQHVSSGTGSLAFATENFAAREAYRPAYDALADALCAVCSFRSAMDVGCAQGFLVDALLAKGVEVYGIELERAALEFASPQAVERISVGNALNVATSTLFGLVACVEVAEHIDPMKSHVLVERLCAMANDEVFFTAASPFQPGHGHINCRPTTDWIYFFSEQGWRLDIDRTIEIRTRLGIEGPAPWIAMNAMLFVREQ